MSQNKLCITLKMPECCQFSFKSAVFALLTFAPPVVGGSQGGHGKADLVLMAEKT